MKVKIINKRLWSNFLKVVSAIANILMFVLMFIQFSQCIMAVIFVGYIVVMAIVLLVLWYKANHKDEKQLQINGTNVKIIYGDIFKRDGIKVIPFNEYFDTTVDNKIISEISLNGQYINNHSKGKEYLDSIIKHDQHLEKNVIERNVHRENGGKTARYILGTICRDNDYFLMAFTHFDEDDCAYLSPEDYVNCLMHMWHELDVFYAGRPVNITLLGNGITRLKNEEILEQELLQNIISTFEMSKVQFGNTSSLTIVLSESVRDKINLYNIGREK